MEQPKGISALTRLLDLGIDRIRNIIRDMAGLSEQSVFTSIESYNKGTSVKKQIFEWSEKLRVLQDETGNVIIPTCLAVVVAIFVISTPLLPFRSTYACL